MSAENFWDIRFKEEVFIYGKKPNNYLRECFLKEDNAGTAYFPGEGEGRNAVFAALRGWRCLAIDGSVEAKKKCGILAGRKNVEIEYIVSDLREQEKYINRQFDVIAFSFVHFNATDRIRFHRSLVSFLKKGGRLFFEVFSKEQMEYDSGGPKNPDMLYSTQDLEKDFKGLRIIQNDKQTVTLDEGPYHQGTASVIRFYAVKE